MEVAKSLGFVDRRRGSRRIYGMGRRSKTDKVAGCKIMIVADAMHKFLWIPQVMLVVSLLSWVYSVNLYDTVRFWWTPVVEMKGRVVAPLQGGEIVIGMRGWKHRGVECEYKGVQAFGIRQAAPNVDLRMARIDIPEDKNTKPKGWYDIGVWKVWPVASPSLMGVEVIITHNCGGTLWSTQIAYITNFNEVTE